MSSWITNADLQEELARKEQEIKHLRQGLVDLSLPKFSEDTTVPGDEHPMKVKDITLESNGRELRIYRRGATIITANGEGIVEAYSVPEDGRFFALSCAIADKEGLAMDIDSLVMLAGVMSSVE